MPETVVPAWALISSDTPTTRTRFVPVLTCENVRVGAPEVKTPEAEVTLSNATCACAVPMHSKITAESATP